MTKENSMIWCDDGNNKYTLLYDDYLNLIKTYDNKYKANGLINYSYKNVKYHLRFYNGYFCGYIDYDGTLNPTYCPHGQDPDDSNKLFDCSHTLTDFYGTKHVKESTESKTFKTEEFAHLECQKIIDSM